MPLIHIKKSVRLLWLLLLPLTLTGCASHALFSADRYGYSHSIPEGHRPPPGECRIWYPDRPAGQQPPPGDCHQLRHHVPPDAVLIYGD
ncbi:hypothetical protein [Methylophaga sp. OBS4]|uniref:hypothetical protein n=1 Tax=Methylophaga sp. OBS4 TaxID=2991935 RepID=UPI00224E23B2|nr:hypothetical protein [Methylophaga sp. OBS4]MCX4187431.1 hypothetical protein [Methylophaga sp. OBS4]